MTPWNRQRSDWFQPSSIMDPLFGSSRSRDEITERLTSISLHSTDESNVWNWINHTIAPMNVWLCMFNAKKTNILKLIKDHFFMPQMAKYQTLKFIPLSITVHSLQKSTHYIAIKYLIIYSTWCQRVTTEGKYRDLAGFLETERDVKSLWQLLIHQNAKFKFFVMVMGCKARWKELKIDKLRSNEGQQC